MPDFGRWTPNGGDPSLNEINRTDRFLDALGSEQQVYATDPGEAELINLLSGWRDEIRHPPLTVPVTPRDAVIALDSAQRTRHRSRRTLALVGSAAAAVLCLGGFVSVVAGAGPGDSLYGLRTMIFGEQPAARDDAVMLASQQLAEVQQLVDQGQWDAAQQKLQTLTTTVATVNDDVQKQELVTQWQELTVKVEAARRCGDPASRRAAAGLPGRGRARHTDVFRHHLVGDHISVRHHLVGDHISVRHRLVGDLDHVSTVVRDGLDVADLSSIGDRRDDAPDQSAGAGTAAVVGARDKPAGRDTGPGDHPAARAADGGDHGVTDSDEHRRSYHQRCGHVQAGARDVRDGVAGRSGGADDSPGAAGTAGSAEICGHDHY